MAENELSWLTPLSSTKREKRNWVYDLETTTDLQKVYLVGCYDGETYRYFESVPMYPEDDGGAVDQFMRWLLSSAGQYTRRLGRWWAHNGGNFDVLYLLRWVQRNQVPAQAIPQQSTIVCLTVGSGRHQWEFVDSYRLMRGSLDDLGKAFGLGSKVPNIDYETLHLDPRRYEYLERDCRLLHGCLDVFSRVVVRNGGTVAITVASTAMNTFRSRFLKKPIAREKQLHEFIRRAFYGGRVEVFRERFDGPGMLNVGDFNSMYPAAMLQPVPIELKTTCEGAHDFESYSRNWLGFVECEIRMPEDTHIPPLPHRTESKLLFPTGILKGVWTSLELGAALEVGAEITWWGKSIWFRGEPIFADYVRHWYGLRDKSRADYDPTIAEIAKYMLNTLFGKTGQNPERQKLWLFPTEDDFAEHCLTPLEIGPEFGIFTEEVTTDASYIVPQLAAWITAVARVKLWREMTGFVRAGYDVWYCDTDSVFTDAPIGGSTELGELKLEDSVESAYFAAPKLYYTQNAAKTKVKMKGFSPGFSSRKLSLADFERVVISKGDLVVARQTKLKEGVRSGARWPAMKRVTKRARKLDEKRVHLADGRTKPIVLKKGAT
jgi:hypothetical protein